MFPFVFHLSPSFPSHIEFGVKLPQQPSFCIPHAIWSPLGIVLGPMSLKALKALGPQPPTPEAEIFNLKVNTCLPCTVDIMHRLFFRHPRVYAH